MVQWDQTGLSWVLVPELLFFHCGNIVNHQCHLKISIKGNLVPKVINFVAQPVAMVSVEIEFHISTFDIVFRLPQYDIRAEGAHMDSFATAHITERFYFIRPSHRHYLYTVNTHGCEHSI